MTKEVMYLKLEDYIERFEERKRGNDCKLKNKSIHKKKINYTPPHKSAQTVHVNCREHASVRREEELLP